MQILPTAYEFVRSLLHPVNREVDEKMESSLDILAKSKKNSEVIAILITEGGKVSEIAKMLADEDLNIEYAYSSAVLIDGKLAVILRVNDLNKAEKILRANSIPILSLDEIKKSFA